ncbi:glycosyltransferase family 4 protein [Desulfitobacterium metallireducens]|uniref:UDP-N-acetylmuramyl pentapeptide phosphotransferase n=1 Tax=Desulfitobacterium metallireducens DSM 15288 TaxID=871968 RepID=W0E6M3_9FIRM|nr:MraY family glycosyltransferase [Desulfitobacterium metallireducens]AHF06545.1 UDP-N-acetylmuramyl pentapeptide phosphotransferase [Desulfitobacterium metallireducens DSM 15288]
MSYVWTFILALLIAVLATPISMILGHRWGAIAIPGGRHVHKRPIPRIGGLAIYAAFWLAIVFTQSWNSDLSGLFVGSTIIVGVGLWDDIKDMRPLTKLFWQIAAASVLVLFGFSMDSLPYFGAIKLWWVGALLAIFWVIGLVNTVNISDGLDGLAAGICFMAAILLFWSANRINQVVPAHLTLALAGSALGFLVYNFHPAKVFMGDTGSMFLGYIIGGISIMGLLKTATVLGLVFPLVVLGMPLTDLTFAIIRRKIHGQSIGQADRGHLHHRLIDAGLSQRQAVLMLYAMSACFGIAAVLGAMGSWIWAAVLLIADFTFILFIMLRRTQALTAFARKHSK